MVSAVSSINTMVCRKCILSTIRVTRGYRTLHTPAYGVMHLNVMDPNLQELSNHVMRIGKKDKADMIFYRTVLYFSLSRI